MQWEWCVTWWCDGSATVVYITSIFVIFHKYPPGLGQLFVHLVYSGTIMGIIGGGGRWEFFGGNLTTFLVIPARKPLIKRKHRKSQQSTPPIHHFTLKSTHISHFSFHFVPFVLHFLHFHTISHSCHIIYPTISLHFIPYTISSNIQYKIIPSLYRIIWSSNHLNSHLTI